MEAAAGLVAADAASETILGILADLSGAVPAAKETHEGLIKLGQQTATAAGTPIPAEVLRGVRVAHGDRNRVVHHGHRWPARGAGEGSPSARRRAGWRRHHVGVASLLDAPDLVEQMRAAEAAIAASNVREALKGCSIGHQLLLTRAIAPVKSANEAGSGRFWRGHEPLLNELERLVESHDARLSPLGSWVVPMALGTSPADYERFRGTVGWSHRVGRRGWRHVLHGDPRDPNAERTEPLPAIDEARCALGELTRMILRLWEMGALVEGDDRAVFDAKEKTTDRPKLATLPAEHYAPMLAI